MTDGPTPERLALARVLLTVFLVVAASMAVGTALAQDGGVPDGPDPGVAFNQSTVTEDRGDVATIGIELTNTRAANVTIGSRWKNYEARVRLRDNDSDGRVRLRMNTYLAGRGDIEAAGVYEAAGNDSIASVNRTIGGLTRPLEPSDYNLSVATNGVTTDSAILELRARSTEELVTWTAPAAAFENVTNASTVATAVDRGVITTTETIAAGDVLVNQIEVSGIYGALAAANLSELVATNVLDVSVRQTNPGTNRQPKTVNVSAGLANDSISVIPDPGNDALYVNVDTGDVRIDHGSLATGDEYEITFGVNESSGLATEPESLSANVSVGSAELGLGDVALAAGPNQTIAGTTSIAPGSVVALSIEAAGNGSVSQQARTTVRSNGSLAAAFNLSGVATNTTVIVNATGPLDTNDEVEVAVGTTSRVEEPATPARLVFENQTTEGATVGVANATLPDGGFVAIHRATDPVRSVLGVSTPLDPGEHANVTIELDEPLDANTTLVAVAHTDSNENEAYEFATNTSRDRPYTTDGENVTASARIVVTGEATTTSTTADTATGSRTPTANTPTTPTTDTETLDTETSTADTATPTDDLPIDVATISAIIGGFVAVLAVVLVIALLAMRRQ